MSWVRSRTEGERWDILGDQFAVRTAGNILCWKSVGFMPKNRGQMLNSMTVTVVKKYARNLCGLNLAKVTKEGDRACHMLWQNESGHHVWISGPRRMHTSMSCVVSWVRITGSTRNPTYRGNLDHTVTVCLDLTAVPPYHTLISHLQPRMNGVSTIAPPPLVNTILPGAFG